MNEKMHHVRELALPATRPAVSSVAPHAEITRGAAAARQQLAATPAAGANLTPMGLLYALRRRQMLALGVAFLAAGICGPAAWLFVPPAQFKAQARLQVIAQQPKVLFRTVETEAGDDYHRYQTTQLTLIKSRLVLNTALQDEQVSKYRMVREQDDAITWLQEKLKVEFLAGSEIMEISLSGNQPQELAGLVNAIKKGYIEEVVNVDIKRRSDRHAKLKKIKQAYTEHLKERHEHQRELAVTAGSDDRQTLALRQQFTMEHMASLRSELLDIQSQKRRAETQLKIRRPRESTDDPMSPGVTTAELNQMVDQDPTVASLVHKLADAEERLSSETVRVRKIARQGAADPSIQVLRDKVDSVRTSLARRRATVRTAVIQQFRRENQEGAPSVPSDPNEQQLVMLNDLEQRLTDEINSVEKGNRSMTENTLDLRELQEEVAQMESAALKVGAEVESLNVELDAPPRIRTIEDAEVPRARDDKRRFMMIGMAMIGSFFFGLIGIAFLELRTQKVDSVDQVPNELGLRVVGALPILPSRTSRGGSISRANKDQHWQALLLESIDATRTMLIHAARTESHRIFMIASAVGSEGKTSLASHLATSLARGGMKTLLVDADLRSPSIHRVFDLPAGAGLSELLRGEVDVAQVITDTAIDELKVVTGGICDQQTIRALSQGCLGSLFGQFREQFDFVIVDSSPILPVADALIIAQQADAVIFSIFRDVSSKTKVSAAAHRLECLGVPILGAVVTGGHGGVYGNYYGPASNYSRLPPSTADSPNPRI
jgi:polysaccharide biosynthesis transport protein